MKLPSWTNQNVVLFHGTTLDRLSDYALAEGEVIEDFNVDLSRSRSLTDFGRGFYTTTIETQAEDWASSLTVRSSYGRRPVRTKPVVLEFSVDRDELSKLDSLAFVWGHLDLRSFVETCRTSADSHNRSNGHQFFDIVYGPLTRYPERKVDEDRDQISVHTVEGVKCLGLPIVKSIGLRRGKRFDDGWKGWTN